MVCEDGIAHMLAVMHLLAATNAAVQGHMDMNIDNIDRFNNTEITDIRVGNKYGFVYTLAYPHIHTNYVTTIIGYYSSVIYSLIGVKESESTGNANVTFKAVVTGIASKREAQAIQSEVKFHNPWIGRPKEVTKETSQVVHRKPVTTLEILQEIASLLSYSHKDNN